MLTFRLFTPDDLQGFRHLLEKGGCALQLLRRQAVQVHEPQEHQVGAVRGDQGGPQGSQGGLRGPCP